MILQEKTLQELRVLINETTKYRSGPELVKFFNKLGFNDVYRQGFPSRWVYTDEKLSNINGTPELDKCIKMVFDPINFEENINILDSLINDFNKYLAFDNWKIVRKGKNICFEKTNSIDDILKNQSEEDLNRDKFLSTEFKEINLQQIIKDITLSEILQNRLEEAEKNIQNNLNLSAIIMMGSLLEGILLNIEIAYPQIFNKAKSAPKDKNNKVKNFVEWTLSDSINVAHEIGFICEDVKKFSHSLRDFRNYIHPFQQMSANFFPNKDTSKICLQVIKAAINQINNKLQELNEK